MKRKNKTLCFLLIFTLLTTVLTPLTSNAENQSTKIHVSFEGLSDYELAAQTESASEYDISVWIEFSYPSIDEAVLDKMTVSERRLALKEYYKPKNEELTALFNLHNSVVSFFTPTAEIIYDDMDSFSKDKYLYYAIAENNLIKKIYIDLVDVEQNIITVNTSEPDYSVSEYMLDIGITDEMYLGSDVKVGMFDGGIPENTDSIVQIKDTLGTTSDHATAVSQFILGLAPDVDLYCVGGEENGSSITLTRAMNWLINDCNVDVINMSMGYGSELNPNPYARYDYFSAYIDGIIRTTFCQIIISAGNNGELVNESSNQVGNIISPAYAANAITVGSSTSAKTRASGSSYACGTPELKKPDLVAPGSYIENPITGGVTGGTSIAAPITTAIVARLLDEYPSLCSSPSSVKAILLESCTKLSGQTLDYDTYVGAGLINYNNARSILNQGRRFTFVKLRSAELNSELTNDCVYIAPGATLRIRFVNLIPGNVENGLSLSPLNINFSRYEISLTDVSQTTVHHRAVVYGATGYITYENNSNVEKLVRVNFKLIYDAYPETTEYVSVTYNSLTHEHVYNYYVPYSDTQHSIFCDCGMSRLQNHSFTALDGSCYFCGQEDTSLETHSHTYNQAAHATSETHHNVYCSCGDYESHAHTYYNNDFICDTCSYDSSTAMYDDHVHNFSSFSSVSASEHRNYCSCGEYVIGTHLEGADGSCTFCGHDMS